MASKNTAKKGGEKNVIRSERKRTGFGRVRAHPRFGRRRRNRYFGSARPSHWKHLLDDYEVDLRPVRSPASMLRAFQHLVWTAFLFTNQIVRI